jgi:GNAT superfamily N-acetyltransferase
LASTIVRLARQEDAAMLPDVERSAGDRFRTVPDLAWIADGGVMSVEAQQGYINAGAVWVAERAGEQICGFLTSEAFDDELHIWEFAVHRDNQGQGIGHRLMDAAYAHAEAAGLRAMTLTTFRGVAWNEPLYQHLGFKTLEAAARGSRLVSVLKREAALGLPADRRCAMRRSVKI